jgi:GINS complex subunit 2
VPLWLAATLRQRKQCKIAPPGWLTVDSLRTSLRDEREMTAFFTEMPFHYIEIASILLKVAAEDIPDHVKIRALVKDIQDIRAAKLR